MHWLISLIGLLTLASCSNAQQLLHNADFSRLTLDRQRPEGWVLQVAEPQTPSIALDSEVRHTGEQSLRIRHQSGRSYSYAMQSIPNPTPGGRFIASVWVRAEGVRVEGIGPRLYVGYDGGLTTRAEGPELDENGNCDWQRIVIPFNSGHHREIMIYVYLHESTGTVWFDGLSLEPAPAVLSPPGVVEPPVLDGVLDDAAWRNPQAAVSLQDADGEPVEEARAFAAVRGDVLYAAFDLPAPAAAGDPDGWENYTAVGLSALVGPRPQALVFMANTQGRLRALRDSLEVDTGQWHHAGRIREGRLQVEIAIPLAVMGRDAVFAPGWAGILAAQVDGQVLESTWTNGAPLNHAAFVSLDLAQADLAALMRDFETPRLRRAAIAYADLVRELNINRLPGDLEGYPQVTEQLDRVGRTLQDLSRRAGAVERLTADDWREVAAALDEYEAQLGELRAASTPLRLWMQTRQSGVRNPVWGVSVTHALHKVHRARGTADLPARDFAELWAARGEAESAQLVAVPITADLQNMQVTWSALRGPAGVIPAAQVSCHAVGYLPLQKPVYHADWEGEWPDVLLPFDRVDVMDDEVLPLWLTVHVPENQPPGTYRGEVVLRPGNAHRLSVPVTVHVWNFTLPATPTLRTSFGLSAQHISRWYHRSEDPHTGNTPELFRRYCELLLQHRISPYLGTEYRPDIGAGDTDLSVWGENIEFCMARGQTSIMLEILRTMGPDEQDYSAEYRENTIRSLRLRAAWLRERGWLDSAYVCAWDEPHISQYDRVRIGGELIREADPDLHILQTICFDDEPAGLVGHPTIWCPITNRWNREFYHARQAAGEEIWWYVCCSPHPPFGNFFIDQQAVAHRILFWQTWQEQVTGFLYWHANRWTGNRAVDRTGTPDLSQWEVSGHKEFKVNGDGLLIYPGRDGTPLASLRLAVIRDGMEDYEYLRLLAAYAANEPRAAELLSFSPGLSLSPRDYNHDPMALLERRRAIGELLHELAAPGE